jgi:hypothetical protein
MLTTVDTIAVRFLSRRSPRHVEGVGSHRRDT